MERSSRRSAIKATRRIFLLRLLFSCSALLNSPPFKALLLFEKPHVRATPSRFAHSIPKQGHRAPRALQIPLLVSRWGLFQSSPLATRTSSAGGMPTTQKAHVPWWSACHFCSTIHVTKSGVAPLRGGEPRPESYAALVYSVHCGRPLSRTVCPAARVSRGAAAPLRRGRVPAFTTIRDASPITCRIPSGNGQKWPETADKAA